MGARSCTCLDGPLYMGYNLLVCYYDNPTPEQFMHPRSYEAVHLHGFTILNKPKKGVACEKSIFLRTDELVLNFSTFVSFSNIVL